MISLPRLRRIVGLRLRSLMRARAVDRELERELAFHVDALIAEQRAAGLPEHAARRAALRMVGNLSSIADACRDTRRVGWIADLGRDLRQGLRRLRAEPGFAVAAILSLAVGMGATVAAWRGVTAAWGGVLHVPDADRYVVVRAIAPDNAVRAASAIDVAAWRDRSQSFDRVAAAMQTTHTLRGDAGTQMWPERVPALLVTPAYFDTLGVRPTLGRAFTHEESRLLDPVPAVMISARLWRQRFGSDPGIVGRLLHIDGGARPIVGVMDDAIAYRDVPVDVWSPLRLLPTREHGSGRALRVTARLRPGVTPAQAEAELNVIAASLGAEYGEGFAGWRVAIAPLDDARVDWSYRPLAIVAAIASLVLIVSCANVSGLLLSRASTRRLEIQRRLDLGATSGRLFRQWLSEELLLGGAGAIGGLGVAAIGLRAITTLAPPPGAPPLAPLGVDAATVAIAALCAIGVTAALAIVSAAAAAPRNAERIQRPMRAWLTGAQVAVTVVVLVGSGLLVNSLLRLNAHDLGFNPHDLLTFEVVVPSARTVRGTHNGQQYFEVTSNPAAVLARLDREFGAIPMVTAVGGSSVRAIDAFVRPRFDVRAGGELLPGVPMTFVTPGYFAAMHTRIVRGRDLDRGDTADAPWVAIVNEAAAARLWPAGDPIGQYLEVATVPDDRPRLVVGVVADIPLGNGDTAATPIVYESYLQQPSRFVAPWINLFGTMTFVIRHDGPRQPVMDAIRRAAARVDPELPLGGLSPVTERLAAGRARLTSLTGVAVILAGIAILLAFLGIYTVVARGVQQRRREIAVRAALGAEPAQIAAVVSRPVLRLLIAGLAAGVFGAATLAPRLEQFLWGVSAFDPLTYALACAVVVIAGAAAGTVPLVRALRIVPSVALRCE